MTATTLAAEQAARTSYGRLLALLVARSRDIAAAEDALSDAFASALSTWPVRGVPENPDAWLLTAARNKEKNRFRHQQVRDASREELERRAIDRALDEATTTAIEIPDERLRFMLVCTHPAIDQAARTPLMLQTVLGLDARRIADAFLVAPTTMGQRLVRAKARIKDAGVRMTLPTPEELPTRIDDILGAVYAAYATGHDDVTGADEAVTGLTAEAIFLARLVVSLLPGEPEAWGLLSLLLACEARRGARLDDEGHFVPLLEQDPTRWSRPCYVRLSRRCARRRRRRALVAFNAKRPFSPFTSNDASLASPIVRLFEPSTTSCSRTPRASEPPSPVPPPLPTPVSPTRPSRHCAPCLMRRYGHTNRIG
jgi:RNA polymerase sigma-70 factor (ECF subfamily)